MDIGDDIISVVLLLAVVAALFLFCRMAAEAQAAQLTVRLRSPDELEAIKADERAIADELDTLYELDHGRPPTIWAPGAPPST